MYYCCGITDTGCVREHNEDAFMINRTVMSDNNLESSLKGPFIVAVADGVAGEADGDVASKMALKMLSDIRPTRRTDFKKKIMDIHRKLRKYGEKHRRSSNMQTTLCALAVDEKGSHSVINVGDSRLYRMRNGSLKQLSTDQSLVQMLYADGRISYEERLYHKNRNIIFPVLGNNSSDPDPQVIPIEPMEHGDLILICSDGLSDYITKGEFEEILSLPLKLPKRLAKLTETAMKNGSPDNITVLAVSQLAEA
ncbi:MAG: serine/threonine-protein phosphatase [Oscillospiraceae bacterium]|nr:serine/threonine-protein phosphatase [Oscillospiraceae bacterium]